MARLVPVGQWRMLTALKWCTKSGNGHCLVLQSCRCSTLAVESSGLNWMIKLSWTAILCYRRAFSVMCFRRSVQLRGRALVEKGLRLPSCCRAVKMRMTGSISCCRKRTYGLPFQPGVLSQRRSPNRSLVKSGAGCRPSICGWRSSCGGGCLLTECTPRPPLGSPKKNSMLCFLTGLPGATTRIRMKKNHIVVLQSKKSKHGGNNAKSGWHTSKDKVRRWSSTSRAFWRHYLVRKQKLMALRSAEIVTELLQSVLQHPAKGLVDEINAPLLTQRFWVQAIYTELLHASSRSRAQRGKEEKRPPHGLVKILCLPYEGRVQERHDRRLDTAITTETLLGTSSWVDSMYVWFAAAWMPLVVDAIRAKNVWWDRLGSQQGTVAFADPQEAPLPGTRELKYKYKKWPMYEEGLSPILDVRANVDWLTLDTRTFYHFFPQLYEGILNDVFTQKASMGWHPASPARVVVSLLLPGGLEVENWLLLARQKRNMWPLQMTTHTVGCSLPTLHAEGTTKAKG